MLLQLTKLRHLDVEASSAAKHSIEQYAFLSSLNKLQHLRLDVCVCLLLSWSG